MPTSSEIRSDPIWQLRNQRALQRFDVLDAEARTLLRTFGPRFTAAEDGDPTFRHCRVCTPDPVYPQCAICDRQFENRSGLRLHMLINPETCQRWGDRKARKWASTV